MSEGCNSTGLSGAMRKEVEESLELLQALAVFASHNFPRTTKLHVETAGCDPKGSVAISASTLKFLIKSGFRALTQEGKA